MRCLLPKDMLQWFFSRSSWNLDHSRSRRFFRDATLKWAENNPQVAHRSLQPPGWSVAENGVDPSQLSIEEYLAFRKWALPSNEQERETAVALVTHVLSTPMTLALFYTRALADSEKLKSPLRLSCVGARAEATLPYEYWKEFLITASLATNSPDISIQVDFVGPDKNPQTLDRTVAWNDSTMALQWYHKGLLHDLDENSWDAYALMNPGLGHRNLFEDWKPTLARLMASGHPILLTAHSEKDAHRDGLLLKDVYNMQVEYTLNPFASRITYEDPFDQHHIVRPNHFIAIIE
eukprot:scaffold880_cov132-Cylindrotheca_fusiformis.AAC.70